MSGFSGVENANLAGVAAKLPNVWERSAMAQNDERPLRASHRVGTTSRGSQL